MGNQNGSPSHSKWSGPQVRAALITAAGLVIAAFVGGFFGGHATGKSDASPETVTRTQTLVVNSPALSPVVATSPALSPVVRTVTVTVPTTVVDAAPLQSASPSDLSSSIPAIAPFDLTTATPVDGYSAGYGYTPATVTASVSGKLYTKALGIRAGYKGAVNFLEFDLGRKYNKLTVDFGFADADKASISGVFEISVDGATKATKQLTFGQTSRFSIPVTRALRVRFTTTAIGADDNGGDTLIWMNPTATV